MSASLRLQEIRDGFERPFWVANVSEIFERLSYYGAFSSLAVYLQEKLSFSTEQTGTLTGLFGGMVWFLAIFGGAVADKLGFRRALSMAYLILAVAYFLIGSIGASWLAPIRGAVPLSLFVGVILILPALGIALVKPCVVGTTARASKPNVRTLGYSIYYTMVNIGGTAGPFVANWAHTHFGLERVFRISALSVFAMFFLILFFFRDPRKPGDEPAPSVLQVVRNFRAVIWPPRFLIFLLIFTGYWIVFWQQYTSLPGFIHTYVDANAHVELILITDAAIVVCLTFIVNYLARKIPPFHAVILGTVISSMSWLVLSFWPTVIGAIVSIAVLAIGEIIQQPPYYAYISRLAPPGQQGTYMGFAFLPIGIGSLVGGWFGGTMMHHFGEVAHHPERAWWAISAVGFVTALLLWIYDRAIKPASAGATLASGSSMSLKLMESREVSVLPPVGARYIVPSSHFERDRRTIFISKVKRGVQTILGNFSYCRLSAVSCRLSATNSAPRPTHFSTTHYSLSSQFTKRRREASACRASEYRGSIFERLLKTFHRARVHFLAQIGAAQIVVRKMARLVTARFHSAFQPRNRFIESAQLDQIRADVVVRIAELRIDFDRALALGNGVFDAALKMIRPAEKRVSLGSGVQFERGLIELHGAIVVALHLGLVSVLEDFPRPRQGFLAHGLNC